MERILTISEAEQAINKLTDQDKHRVMNDQVCFGEYFIGNENNVYFRINPINVIMSNGRPVSVNPDDSTII
ncbi:hypothetical protein [Pararcticibacter amylolyticus]|uniref:Uncharacterized protein n=1 Tax=Pararcticibacter amylolyticus TaxID=2173175 RepID=A0A2U2PEF5_9SPHI|nr:hypothetical protein [Pararcticibacter amylolyticus]PWG79753.1 hypothetical protein DDR33_15170 [Pararcticibacter amylolyticus]